MRRNYRWASALIPDGVKQKRQMDRTSAMRIILFALFFFSEYSGACNEKNIICNTVCKHDDDELGIILNDKCYCANYRDLDKYTIKVPKRGRMVQVTPPPRNWVD